MGKIVLYGLEPSPPVRACKMTLAALGLQYEYKLVNLLAGEHKTKDFLRRNPQHTVPMIEDDGKFIWESHAIMAYLVRKYGKDDSLYPKDLYQRAVVDQRLHFESGVLFQGCLRNIALPIFYRNETEVPREKIDAIFEAFDFLEAFLANTTGGYLCGSNVTIADFSCMSSVSSMIGLAPVEPTKYPNLYNWMEKMTKMPNYDETNGNGAQMIIDMLSDKIKRIV